MNTQGAFLFLVTTVIEIYAFLVLTRLIMQMVRADFYNPVSQFVVKATQPVLAPLRRIIPSMGRVDTASLVLVLVLLMIKVAMLLIFKFGSAGASPLFYLEISVRMLAELLLDYIFWAILLRIILSWVAPDPYQPFNRIVIQITEPVMAPARRLLPPMGGLDFSAMLILLAIHFLRILIGV